VVLTISRAENAPIRFGWADLGGPSSRRSWEVNRIPFALRTWPVHGSAARFQRLRLALERRIREHHRFSLRQLMDHLRFLIAGPPR
jgi:hypothetical protein